MSFYIHVDKQDSRTDISNENTDSSSSSSGTCKLIVCVCVCVRACVHVCVHNYTPMHTRNVYSSPPLWLHGLGLIMGLL